jgi:hypothetical protein
MDEIDEVLAMGAQLDDEALEPRDTRSGSPLPELDALVHEVGASYALAAFSGHVDDALTDDDETALDPVILAGLVHA